MKIVFYAIARSYLSVSLAINQFTDVLLFGV